MSDSEELRELWHIQKLRTNLQLEVAKTGLIKELGTVSNPEHLEAVNAKLSMLEVLSKLGV